MKLLVTGITGKVGTNFPPEFLANEEFSGWSLRGLCNNPFIDHATFEIVRGSDMRGKQYPTPAPGLSECDRPGGRPKQRICTALRQMDCFGAFSNTEEYGRDHALKMGG